MTGKKFLEEKLQEIRSKISDGLSRADISQRDKKILLLVGVLCLVLFVYLVVFSFSSSIGRLESKVVKLEADLQKSKSLKIEYLQSSSELKRLLKNAKKRTTPLISEVERILLDESVNRKDFSIKDFNLRDRQEEELYNERAVDVKIKKVTLKKMVDILYAFQSRPTNLKIGGLKLKTRFDNKDSVDLDFRVSTFEFKDIS